MPKARIKDLDFKPRPPADRRGLRVRHLHWLALGLSGVTGIALLLSGQHNAQAVAGAVSEPALQEVPLTLPGLPLPPEVADADPQPAKPAPVENWRRVEVRSGDTLAGIFAGMGLSTKTMYDVISAGEAAKALTRIFPGEEISFLLDEQGQLKSLRYPIDDSVTLHVDHDGTGFKTTLLAAPLERRLAHATGTIESSLFSAGKQAGLSDALIMEFADIFGWDVDFALDLRAGDQFAVVYEELYRDGEKIRAGNIVAAEFTAQGRTYRAVSYTDPDGNRQFYTPEGQGMRKAFLRSPVDFRRISSGFNPNRHHPVLGVKRPHMGVDYAAATGTPIRAAGDGKVVHIGWKGGYGRTVILQHGSRYSTLYAHMSRFGSGLSVGSRVRQGQVIGFVGSSGLATGPHLHYEFRVDGVHRNPVTVALPQSEPLRKDLIADFRAKTAPLLAQLDVVSRSQVAQRQ